MNKIMTDVQAVSRIKTGDTVMIGGFLQGGSPEKLIGALVSSSDATNLTIINNDTGWDWQNTYKLQMQGRVSKVYATWIGGNSYTNKMFMEDPQSVVCTPQGTFAESIRAAAYGIPEFLSPTGVGTLWEEGKETKIVDGKKYIVEKALHGDVALIHAAKVDKFGNCYLRGATKNFGAYMPQACKYSVVEAEEIVETGDIDPDLVTISGIFINAIVQI